MVPYRQMTAAVVRPSDMIWAESRGTMAGMQGPPHFVDVTSLTAVPENLMHGMVPPSRIYSGLGENAGTGSVADTNTQGPRPSSPPTLQNVNMVWAFAPGAQPLATIPQHVLPHDSGIGQRQQSILREDAQALVAGGFDFGINRTENPITPGASGGIASDRWTGTLRWQCQREGPWFQVQAVAADGIRNPCVDSFVICKLVEDSYSRRMFSIWPRILQIQLFETAISSQDVQAWILKTGTSVARIQGESGDSHQFDDLVKLVRRSGSVSPAGVARPPTLLHFGSTHWRAGRWDDRDFSSCPSTRTYCARSPQPASRAYQCPSRDSQLERSAVCPRAPGVALDQVLGPRLWAPLRPNNDYTPRQCKMRQL